MKSDDKKSFERKESCDESLFILQGQLGFSQCLHEKTCCNKDTVLFKSLHFYIITLIFSLMNNILIQERPENSYDLVCG